MESANRRIDRLETSEAREQVIELRLQSDQALPGHVELFARVIQLQFDAGDPLFQFDGLGDLQFVGG